MFSSYASSFGRPRQMANLYHQVGVETGVASANPHRLVQMLYDGFLDAVKQAREAMADGRIEHKGRHIGHAARILDEGLKASLNLEAGGELARNLHDLYVYVSMRLIHANLRNDDAALEEAHRLIEPLGSAWSNIGPRMPS